jgi:retron-type reverse transcriptase
MQRAVLLIIEPIFEADFLDCSHGFRPNRNAHDAMKQIQANIKDGRQQVYDADLSSYFDTIDHEELMRMVEERIADRSVLKLIAGMHVVEMSCIRKAQKRQRNANQTQSRNSTGWSDISTPIHPLSPSI